MQDLVDDCLSDFKMENQRGTFFCTIFRKEKKKNVQARRKLSQVFFKNYDESTMTMEIMFPSFHKKFEVSSCDFISLKS